MAFAFALSVAKNLPSESCTLKDGDRGVDFIAFTALKSCGNHQLMLSLTLVCLLYGKLDFEVVS